jgi:hypothetical protein
VCGKREDYRNRGQSGGPKRAFVHYLRRAGEDAEIRYDSAAAGFRSRSALAAAGKP